MTHIENASPALTEALGIAKHGIKIIPLHFPTKNGCSCGNSCGKSSGKHPISKGWKKHATQDTGEIQRIWNHRPLLNIGIPTGLLNGLFIVDVDGKEGSDTLREWITEFKDLPATWQVETGNGFHLYYKNPQGLRVPNTVNCIGFKIDTRGEDGLSVAPGSLHTNGTRYSWAPGRSPDDMVLADPPQWLVTKIIEVLHEQKEAKQLGLDYGSMQVDFSKEITNDLNEKISTLMNKRSSFKKIMTGQLRFTSASERDWALANELAKTEWAEQEIVDFLIHHRKASGDHRKHPLYYKLTAGKAITQTNRKSPATRDRTNTKDNLSIPECSNKIILEPQLGARTRQVMEALCKTKNLNIFQRGNTLFRVVNDENGIPRLIRLTVDAIHAITVSLFEFYRHTIDRKTGEKQLVHCDPAERIFKNIIYSSDGWQFSHLKYTASTPMIKEHGEIIHTSGYNSSSQIYFQIDSQIQQLCVSDRPTKREIQNAVRTLKEELFPDVAFKNEKAFANTVALFLTPLITLLVEDGIFPAFMIDATKRGSGKGTLYEIFCYVIFGSILGMDVYPNREEEIEKKLMSTVMCDSPLLLFDNVKRKIDSAALEAFITARIYGGRALGTNNKLSFPKRTLVILTANNPQYSEDMGTRFCRITLDAGVSRPDQRKFKKEHILQDVKVNRLGFLQAFFTIIKYWINEGKPIPKDAPKTRFRTWSNIISGILSTAGIRGFWKEDEDSVSHEELEWALFLQKWHKLYPEYKTVGELMHIFNPNDEHQIRSELVDILPEELSTKISGISSESQKNANIGIGKALTNKVGTPFGEKNYRIQMKMTNQGKKYCVVCH